MRTWQWLAPAALAAGAVLGVVARAAVPKPGALAQPPPPNQVGAPPKELPLVIDENNPSTPEKIALGAKLFFDARTKLLVRAACSAQARS